MEAINRVKPNFGEFFSKLFGNNISEEPSVEEMSEEEIIKILEKEDKILSTSYKTLSLGKIFNVRKVALNKNVEITDINQQGEKLNEKDNIKKVRRKCDDIEHEI